MTLKILPLNGAYTANGSPATVVGSWPVLPDDSDATYIQSDASGGTLDHTVGVEALAGYVDGDPIELHIRVSCTGGGSLSTESFLFLQTVPDEISGASYRAQFTQGSWNAAAALGLPDGTIRDVVLPMRVRPGYTVADVVAALEAGAYLAFNTLTNPGWETSPVAQVYEAAVHVGEDSAFIPRTTVRKYPRDAGRIWPPTRERTGVRRAGGYQ